MISRSCSMIIFYLLLLHTKYEVGASSFSYQEPNDLPLYGGDAIDMATVKIKDDRSFLFVSTPSPNALFMMDINHTIGITANSSFKVVRPFTIEDDVAQPRSIRHMTFMHTDESRCLFFFNGDDTYLYALNYYGISQNLTVLKRNITAFVATNDNRIIWINEKGEINYVFVTLDQRGLEGCEFYGHVEHIQVFENFEENYAMDDIYPKLFVHPKTNQIVGLDMKNSDVFFTNRTIYDLLLVKCTEVPDCQNISHTFNISVCEEVEFCQNLTTCTNDTNCTICDPELQCNQTCSEMLTCNVTNSTCESIICQNVTMNTTTCANTTICSQHNYSCVDTECGNTPCPVSLCTNGTYNFTCVDLKCTNDTCGNITCSDLRCENQTICGTDANNILNCTNTTTPCQVMNCTNHTVCVDNPNECANVSVCRISNMTCLSCQNDTICLNITECENKTTIEYVYDCSKNKTTCIYNNETSFKIHRFSVDNAICNETSRCIALGVAPVTGFIFTAGECVGRTTNFGESFDLPDLSCNLFDRSLDVNYVHKFAFSQDGSEMMFSWIMSTSADEEGFGYDLRLNKRIEWGYDDPPVTTPALINGVREFDPVSSMGFLTTQTGVGYRLEGEGTQAYHVLENSFSALEVYDITHQIDFYDEAVVFLSTSKGLRISMENHGPTPFKIYAGDRENLQCTKVFVNNHPVEFEFSGMYQFVMHCVHDEYIEVFYYREFVDSWTFDLVNTYFGNTLMRYADLVTSTLKYYNKNGVGRYVDMDVFYNPCHNIFEGPKIYAISTYGYNRSKEGNPYDPNYEVGNVILSVDGQRWPAMEGMYFQFKFECNATSARFSHDFELPEEFEYLPYTSGIYTSYAFIGCEYPRGMYRLNIKNYVGTQTAPDIIDCYVPGPSYADYKKRRGSGSGGYYEMTTWVIEAVSLVNRKIEHIQFLSVSPDYDFLLERGKVRTPYAVTSIVEDRVSQTMYGIGYYYNDYGAKKSLFFVRAKGSVGWTAVELDEFLDDFSEFRKVHDTNTIPVPDTLTVGYDDLNQGIPIINVGRTVYYRQADNWMHLHTAYPQQKVRSMYFDDFMVGSDVGVYTQLFEGEVDPFLPELNILEPNDFGMIMLLNEDNFTTLVVVSIFFLIYFVFLFPLCCCIDVAREIKYFSRWLFESYFGPIIDENDLLPDDHKDKKRRYCYNCFVESISANEWISCFYIPDRDIQEKKKAFCGHSEKLTILYVMILASMTSNALTYEVADPTNVIQYILAGFAGQLVSLIPLGLLGCLFGRTGSCDYNPPPDFEKYKKKYEGDDKERLLDPGNDSDDEVESDNEDDDDGSDGSDDEDKKKKSDSYDDSDDDSDEKIIKMKKRKSVELKVLNQQQKKKDEEEKEKRTEKELEEKVDEILEKAGSMRKSMELLKEKREKMQKEIEEEEEKKRHKDSSDSESDEEEEEGGGEEAKDEDDDSSSSSSSDAAAKQSSSDNDDDDDDDGKQKTKENDKPVKKVLFEKQKEEEDEDDDDDEKKKKKEEENETNEEEEKFEEAINRLKKKGKTKDFQTIRFKRTNSTIFTIQNRTTKVVSSVTSLPQKPVDLVVRTVDDSIYKKIRRSVIILGSCSCLCSTIFYFILMFFVILTICVDALWIGPWGIIIVIVYSIVGYFVFMEYMFLKGIRDFTDVQWNEAKKIMRTWNCVVLFTFIIILSLSILYEIYFFVFTIVAIEFRDFTYIFFMWVCQSGCAILIVILIFNLLLIYWKMKEIKNEDENLHVVAEERSSTLKSVWNKTRGVVLFFFELVFKKNCFPCYCKFCWFALSWVSIFIFSYILIIYGIKFVESRGIGTDRRWLLSCVVTFGQSCFIEGPLQIFWKMVVFALIMELFRDFIKSFLPSYSLSSKKKKKKERKRDSIDDEKELESMEISSKDEGKNKESSSGDDDDDSDESDKKKSSSSSSNSGISDSGSDTFADF